MKKFLQVLFFIGIISAVFASSSAPDGCHDGKVWATAHENNCDRCECHDNRINCFYVPQPCQAEGTAYEFFRYPDVPEPPTFKPYPLAHPSVTTESQPESDQTTHNRHFIPSNDDEYIYKK